MRSVAKCNITREPTTKIECAEEHLGIFQDSTADHEVGNLKFLFLDQIKQRAGGLEENVTAADYRDAEDTHRDGSIVEANCEHAVRRIPQVTLMLALIGRRTDRLSGGIEPLWIDGVRIWLRGTGRDVGNFASADSGLKGVEPSLRNGAEVW